MEIISFQGIHVQNIMINIMYYKIYVPIINLYSNSQSLHELQGYIHKFKWSITLLICWSLSFIFSYFSRNLPFVTQKISIFMKSNRNRHTITSSHFSQYFLAREFNSCNDYAKVCNPSKLFSEYVQWLVALILRDALDNRDDWFNWNSLAWSCHRILTGLRQMMSQPTPTGRRLVVNERHRHCLRPSSARPTDGFLCQRSCLSILSRGTWTQFKYYLITSLPSRTPRCGNLGDGWSAANGQFLARTC